MSTILDYQGRRYDLLGFRPDGRGPLLQSLFDEQSTGEIITGIGKLSQRFLLELMTDVGSMKFLPTRGTTFLQSIRQGKLQTEEDVLAEFNFAVADIRRNLADEDPTDTPDDERFSDAQVEAITIAAGQLQMTIALTSRAGESRQIILPIKILP